jgi:hypothetical protein
MHCNLKERKQQTSVFQTLLTKLSITLDEEKRDIFKSFISS